MDGKSTVSSFYPKHHKPLDTRLFVANQTDREWLDGKYWGMVVYQEDEEKKYVLVKGYNSDDINDPLNWLSESDYFHYIDSIENYTYEELKTLVESKKLILGKKYKLTDYKFGRVLQDNNGGFALYNEETEELILTAKSNNSFFPDVISVQYPFDEIKYQFLNNTIGNPYNFLEGIAKGGVDLGGDIIISNITENSFDVNIELIYDDNFGIYVESADGSDYAEFYFNDLNSRFYVEALGGTNFRITLTGLNFPINDVNGAYIEILTSEKIADKPGKIVYRYDPLSNVGRSYDYRNYLVRVYKADTASIQYNSTTIYSKGDVCYYNGNIYASAVDGNVGNTPPSTPTNSNWVIAVYKGDEYFMFYEPNYYISNTGKSIPKDYNSYKDVPLVTLDGKKYIACLSNNIHYDNTIEFDDNIFIESISIDEVKFGVQSRNNTFLYMTSITGLELGTGSSENVFSGINGNGVIATTRLGTQFSRNYVHGMEGTILDSRFGHNVISGNISITFGFKDSYGNFIAYHFSNNKGIYGFNNNTFLGYIFGNDFGENFMSNTAGNNFIKNKFGGTVSNNTFGNDFRNNEIGFESRYMTFGNYCQYNKIGIHFWYVNVGDYFQYNIVGDDSGGDAPSTTYITFLDNIFGNRIGNGCRLNNYPTGFRYNTVRDGVYNLDFNGGTHIINSYHCDIMLSESGVVLRYIDASGNMVITSPTS